MRGLFSQVGRGVVALMVVASLAMPAVAKPVEKERRPPSKIVKLIETLIKSLGDGIIVPRP